MKNIALIFVKILPFKTSLTTLYLSIKVPELSNTTAFFMVNSISRKTIYNFCKKTSI